MPFSPITKVQGITSLVKTMRLSGISQHKAGPLCKHDSMELAHIHADSVSYCRSTLFSDL